MTKPGRLQRIEIDRLFDARKTLHLTLDPSQPTVLTGGNGTGKSTILRVVGAASAMDLDALLQAPLTALRLYFDSIPDFEFVNDKKVTSVRWGTHRHALRSQSNESLPDWAMEALTLDSSEGSLLMRLRESAREHDVPSYEYQQIRDALMVKRTGRTAQKSPTWYREFSDAFTVLHVTDQRLVINTDPETGSHPVGRPRSPRRAVVAASRDIAQRMLQIDSDYARASQQRDRLFPRDVISAMSKQDQVSNEDLHRLLTKVRAKRETLREVGLLDAEQAYEADNELLQLDRPDVRPVIATFLSSTLDKLQVLDDLSVRLQTFKQFLDARFRTKRLILRRRDGVRVGLENGHEIEPEHLSSGEQQLFVLAYEILFRATDNSLLIVDEPEISLHVLWQDKLIEDLMLLGKPSDVRFLMATHSPALIAPHPDLERSLDRDEE